MVNQGKFYFLYYFVCINCQKGFNNANAYSPFAANLGETYCVDCANWKYFNSSLKFQSNNSLSANPYSIQINSTNENTNSIINPDQVFNREKTNFKEKNSLNNQNQTKQKILQEVVQKPIQKPQTSESTPQDKRITGRTKQLNIKVKEKTYWKLKELASKNKCLMTEMFEKILEGYGKKK